MFSRRVLSFLVVLALIASACGGDIDDASADVVAPEPTPTNEPEPTATTAPEPTATTAPEPTATPKAEEVDEEAPSDAEDVEQGGEFYDAPGDLQVPIPLPAGSPGELIATETLEMDGAFGQRLLYYSTSAEGEDIAVSGFVAYPDDEPPADGWPLVAWAHGTTGLGDSCAPSLNAENDQLALALVNFGYAVVSTDYEGLGTPGVHPYVVGTSEAHSVLDSVRAAQNLDLPVTDRWVAFGHSQGGHAAMFTGQLQPTYAPELDLIGVVAGAPPSQMGSLDNALAGGNFQGYLIMTAVGLAAADSSLDLADVLTEEALDLIDVVETGCTADIFEAYNPLEYDDLTIVDDPATLDDWGAAVRAQDTNQLPVTMPLLIIHGGEDEQIPVESSAALFEQLCAFGDQGPTVRNVYEGQSHAGILTTFAAVPDLLAWVSGRFAGTESPDDCVR